METFPDGIRPPPPKSTRLRPSGSGTLRSPTKTIPERSSDAERGGHVRHEKPQCAFFQISKRPKESCRIGIRVGKTSHDSALEGRFPQTYVSDLPRPRESRNLRPDLIFPFPEKERERRRVVPMPRPGGVGEQLGGFGEKNLPRDGFKFFQGKTSGTEKGECLRNCVHNGRFHPKHRGTTVEKHRRGISEVFRNGFRCGGTRPAARIRAGSGHWASTVPEKPQRHGMGGNAHRHGG